MNIKSRKGFDINLILSRLSRARTLNADGSISMQGFVLDEYESFLRTSVVAEGQSHAFVNKIVHKAMHQEQDLTEDKFIGHCNRIAESVMRKERKKFKVLFPVWGGKNLFSGRRKWNDVNIAFDISTKSAFFRRAKLERAEQLKTHESKKTVFLNGLQNLPFASCSVQAIDVRDAFELAESAIIKELGLYSLFSGRGKFLFSSEPDKPINTVLIGPHMTVHDLSGAISVDMFWYNRWPSRMTETNRSQADIIRIKKGVEKVRKRLREIPWRDKAELALARHYSAFGQSDLEASFLDGWRLLEFIGGPPNEKSEKLVQRAAWFFKDRDKMCQIGLHLKERRNLISHGRPIREERNEPLAFQMKELLSPLLKNYLMNPFNFKSVEEFWKFCDLPVDRAERVRRARHLELASKFRGEN